MNAADIMECQERLSGNPLHLGNVFPSFKELGKDNRMQLFSLSIKMMALITKNALALQSPKSSELNLK